MISKIVRSAMCHSSVSVPFSTIRPPHYDRSACRPRHPCEPPRELTPNSRFLPSSPPIGRSRERSVRGPISRIIRSLLKSKQTTVRLPFSNKPHPSTDRSFPLPLLDTIRKHHPNPFVLLHLYRLNRIYTYKLSTTRFLYIDKTSIHNGYVHSSPCIARRT